MISRAIDKNGDWMFGRGRQCYVSEIDALKQNIKTRLRQWVGDCYYRPEEGVDWNNLLEKGREELLDLDIKRVILQTGGVLRITDYSSTLNHDTRTLTVSATVESIFGQVPVNEVINE